MWCPPQAPEGQRPALQSPTPTTSVACGMCWASSLQMRFFVGTCACGSEDAPLVSFLPFAAPGWPRSSPVPEFEQRDTGPRKGAWSTGPALALLWPHVRTRASVPLPVCHLETTDASLLLSLKKEGPSAAPVFTVDYGELDFQWREKTPEPSAPCAPEQTEYATIVFPSRPGSPGRRASAHSPQGPQPLSPEDGPCPWPL